MDGLTGLRCTPALRALTASPRGDLRVEYEVFPDAMASRASFAGEVGEYG